MVTMIVPKQKHQMAAKRRMIVIMVSKVFDDCDSGEYSILYPLASKATTHSGFVNPTKLQICPLVDIAVVATTSLSYRERGNGDHYNINYRDVKHQDPSEHLNCSRSLLNNRLNCCSRRGFYGTE